MKKVFAGLALAVLLLTAYRLTSRPEYLFLAAAPSPDGDELLLVASEESQSYSGSRPVFALLLRHDLALKRRAALPAAGPRLLRWRGKSVELGDREPSPSPVIHLGSWELSLRQLTYRELLGIPTAMCASEVESRDSRQATRIVQALVSDDNERVLTVSEEAEGSVVRLLSSNLSIQSSPPIPARQLRVTSWTSNEIVLINADLESTMDQLESVGDYRIRQQRVGRGESEHRVPTCGPR